MKRLLIFGFMLLLIGCENKNIIQVNRIQDGFKSELIATIERNDADDFLSYQCDQYNYCVTRYYDDETKDTTNINLLTNEIKLIEEENNSNQTEEQIIYETDEFKIIYEHEIVWNEETNNTINYVAFFYEKDGNRHLLYEGDEWREPQEYDNAFATSYPKTDEFVLLIKEEDKISIKKVDDGCLVEIDSFPLFYKNAELLDYFRLDESFVRIYESDEIIYILEQEKETIYKKNLEEDFHLKEFWYDPNLIMIQYENNEEFYFIMNSEETKIKKELDGYLLEDYNLDDQVYTYKKDGYVKIMINDEIYDLGYPTKYILTDDALFFTSKDRETNESQTLYIDLKAKEKYILSEPIDMNDIRVLGNKYLVRGYGNSKSQYSILKFNDNECTLIELPFTLEFKHLLTLSDNKIVFIHEQKDRVSFYRIELN